MKADKLLYNTEARITKKQGNGISGRIFFEAISDRELSQRELFDIQVNLGYHPHGYDMFTVTKTYTESKYIYRWACSASCD